MLLVPLVTGAAVALFNAGHIAPVLFLTTAVLALFWLRTPVESWLGTGTIHAQSRQERQFVCAVILPLAAVAAVALCALFWRGKNRDLAWLGALVALAFAAQMLLRKLGRTARMAAEVAGAVVLTSTAPAAYSVATGSLDGRAWALWLLNWLFAADQIHFVWLRIRGTRAAGWREKFTLGWSFLLGNIFLVSVLAIACLVHWLPGLALLAFVPILFRGLAWFAEKPQPIVVRRLGWTELVHALVFATLLIAGFALAR